MDATAKLTPKSLIMNILNGISLGTIVALVPSALLGSLLGALKPIFPFGQTIIDLTNLSMLLLASVSALVAAHYFKMTPIQAGLLAIVAEIGSGNWQIRAGAFILKGTGDVVNIILTMVLGVLFLQLLGNRLKAYNVLLLPVLMIVVVGTISVLMLPYVRLLTTGLGDLVKSFTQMQPLLMGILMAISFCVLIVTPISSVAIALTISLSGVAAGAANLGIVACGFTLAFLGYGANSFGTSITHFLGSPKIQMANLFARPIVFIPLIINAAILGTLGAIFNIQGTAQSAGFGFSGLIGPITAYNLGTQGLNGVILLSLLFVILPIILGYLSRYLFIKKLRYFSSDALQLKFN